MIALQTLNFWNERFKLYNSRDIKTTLKDMKFLYLFTRFPLLYQNLSSKINAIGYKSNY